jgi:hypothetical protein
MDHEKHVSQSPCRFAPFQSKAIGVRLFDRVNQSIDARRR